MRVLTRLGFFVALVSLGVGACGSGSSGPGHGVSWHVDRSPFRITITSAGASLLQQDAGARLRYQLVDGTQHHLTDVTAEHGDRFTVATDEPGRTATVTIVRRSHGVRLAMALSSSANVSQVYDAFATQPREHFMGGGERGAPVDLRGQIVSIKVSNVCSYAPAAFFQSSRGYGLRLETRAVAALAFPGSTGGAGCVGGATPGCAFPPLEVRLEVCVKGAQLSEDVYVGDPSETHAAYVADVGRPSVPPLSQYALIKWRDAVDGPAQLFEDVRRLRAAHIPVGWVLLDNPWETCVGSLAWAGNFPDPRQMIRSLHAQHVKLMLWVSPSVFCPDGAGYPSSGLIASRVGWTLDLANPAIASEFAARVQKALSVGVDGVKGDRGDETDLEQRAPTLQNDYPVLFQRIVVGALRKLRRNDFATMFRAASPPSAHIAHGFWNGDQPGDFTGLQRTIRQAATAGLAGFGVWGSDIGGYSSAQLTPEVFARWAQLGSISPVMEVGGTGPNATPWVLGKQALAALREAARLHYALIPLFDQLVRRGEPVLRPLAYAFPSDPGSWRADLELLVGPSLLAAPVTGPGTTPSVYLPPGTWVDVHTGRTVEGGHAFTRPTSLLELPLYVRAGAVVPFHLRSHADPLWSDDELANPEAAGYLATAGAELRLKRQPRTVQIFVPAAAVPRRVTIGGRSVPFSWQQAAMPGAIVRLPGPSVTGRVGITP